MLEAASLFSFYLAFALLHAAEPRRLPGTLRPGFPAFRRGAQLLAFGVSLLGIWLWVRSSEGDLTAGLLVALTALSSVATVFVLMAPVWPRVVWGVALASAPLIATFSVLGMLHGEG